MNDIPLKEGKLLLLKDRKAKGKLWKRVRNFHVVFFSSKVIGARVHGNKSADISNYKTLIIIK